MPHTHTVLKIIEIIEANLKQLALTADKNQIEQAIRTPIKTAFELSHNKKQLYRSLSLALHPDRLTQRKDGLAQCLRAFFPSNEALLNTPQQLIEQCYKNPSSGTTKPTPVYTNEPDHPGSFREAHAKEAEERLLFLCCVSVVVETLTGVPRNVVLVVLSPLMLVEREKLDALQDAVMEPVKKAAKSVTACVNSVLLPYGRFFTPSRDANKTTTNDDWVNLNNFAGTEEDEEGYVMITFPKTIK